jgi:hypothetical protein
MIDCSTAQGTRAAGDDRDLAFKLFHAADLNAMASEKRNAPGAADPWILKIGEAWSSADFRLR